MGFGDELMAAGQAKRFSQHVMEPVAIIDQHRRFRWHELWENLPYIINPSTLPPHPTVASIVNASGARPYIKYPFTVHTGCSFTDWKAADNPPEIILSDAELSWVEQFKEYFGPFVLMEPTPQRKNPNRRWLEERWQVVVDATIREINWVQPWHGHSGPIDGIKPAGTPGGLRHLAALMYAADGYVGVEGGLAHMAAAFRKPAVVLWGGCISAANLSYPFHVNIVDGGPQSPCGRWVPCEHCQDVWQGLSVKVVIDHILETFGRGGLVDGLSGSGQ